MSEIVLTRHEFYDRRRQGWRSLGQVVSDVFSGAIWCLIEAPAKPQEVAGLRQALEVDERYARRGEVSRARDPQPLDEADGVLPVK